MHLIMCIYQGFLLSQFGFHVAWYLNEVLLLDPLPVPHEDGVLFGLDLVIFSGASSAVDANQSAIRSSPVLADQLKHFETRPVFSVGLLLVVDGLLTKSGSLKKSKLSLFAAVMKKLGAKFLAILNKYRSD